MHHVDSSAVALKREVEFSRGGDKPKGLYLCSTATEIRFHVFYAIERILELARLTNDAEIETLLLRRLTTLLTEFKPPSCKAEALSERTRLWMDGLSCLNYVAGEKIKHILGRMIEDPTEVQRLERWTALVVLFANKRSGKA